MVRGAAILCGAEPREPFERFAKPYAAERVRLKIEIQSQPSISDPLLRRIASAE